MHSSSCLMAPLKNKAEQSVLVIVVSFSSVLSSFGNAVTLQSVSLFFLFCPIRAIRPPAFAALLG